MFRVQDEPAPIGDGFIGEYGRADRQHVGRVGESKELDQVGDVVGVSAAMSGFSLLKFLSYIKEELLIVLGTSSSETVLPRMMAKLENLGCAKPIVGLVIPTGYSFNLDGTSIYLSMSVIFLAQLYNVSLSPGELLTILGILMVTSKGAAGVTGSGFIVLASTLTAIGKIPVEGLAPPPAYLALHPAATEALYMVADGKGGHVFASTLAEHNANVAKWFAIRRARGEM